MGRRGKALNGDARTIILRVIHFFELEKANGKVILPVEQALARTMQATGVSEGTIARIKQEAKKIMDEQTKKVSGPVPLPDLATPSGFKSRPKVYTLNSQQIEALCDIMLNKHSEGEPLSCLRILDVARSEFDFKGGKTTLNSILRSECGYRYIECHDSRHVGKKCWLPDANLQKKIQQRKQTKAGSSGSAGIVKKKPKYDDKLLSSFVKAYDPVSATASGVKNEHDYSRLTVEDPYLKERDIKHETQPSSSESDNRNDDNSDSESMPE